MNYSHLRTIIRRITRNYKMTILTLTGLAVGIASTLIIFSKIQYEKSFDSFHSHSADIYRVVRFTSGLQYLNGELEYRAGIHFPVPGEIKKTIPEVETVSSVLYIFGNKITVPASSSQKPAPFKIKEGIVFADPEFFDVFDFVDQPLEWLSGNKSSLNEISAVILTRDIEKLLFKGERAMGKIIEIGGQVYTVKGVIDNFPSNSDFPFKVIISMPTFTEKFAKGVTSNWGSISDNFQCFVKVRKDADIQLINQKLNLIIKNNLPEYEASKRSMKLQPLKDLHRDERFGNFKHRTVSQFILNGLSILSFFIIVIVSLNFSSIIIASSIKNSKDTSVRRIIGCGKFEILNGFFTETFLLTTIASVIGLFLSYGFMKTQGELAGVPIDFFMQLNLNKILIFLIIIIFISFVASLFPGILFTSNSALSTLKLRKKGNSINRVNLNKVTIMVQFVVATILVISTFVVLKQLNYIHTKDLGFKPQNIITSPIPESDFSQVESLKTRLLACSEVSGVSLCSVNPVKSNSWIGVSFVYNEEQHEFDSEYKNADSAFFNLNGFEVIAGRVYSANDKKSVVVNTEFAREAGIEDPAGLIGESVMGITITGVVNNSHSTSLHQKLRPCVFTNNVAGFNEIEIKLKPVNEKSYRSLQLTQIKKIWTDIFPDDDFDFSFLTDQIDAYYQAESNLFRLLLLFTFITLFLCCLGIFGLSVFINEQRIKEIGIRKVNGAKVNEVIALLNKDFILWIAVAFIIAYPLAWYFMHKWLENFAYKTELSWWIFAAAGAVAVSVAVLTVSFQSYKASIRNPVESLRYE